MNHFNLIINPISDVLLDLYYFTWLGTDEKAITTVYGRRTVVQHQEIIQTFKTVFGKDLLKELKSEISGNFRLLVLALSMTKPVFDAHEIRKAVKVRLTF